MHRLAANPWLVLCALAVLLVSPIAAAAAASADAAGRSGSHGAVLDAAAAPVAMIVSLRGAPPSFDELRPVKPIGPAARLAAAPALIAHLCLAAAADSVAAAAAIPLYTRLARLTL